MSGALPEAVEPARPRPYAWRMTVDKLTDLLVAKLLRDHGKSKHHWRTLIGPIRLYSRATHPHCNWSVTPTGPFADVARLETLLDELRLAHPFVTA